MHKTGRALGLFGSDQRGVASVKRRVQPPWNGRGVAPPLAEKGKPKLFEPFRGTRQHSLIA